MSENNTAHDLTCSCADCRALDSAMDDFLQNQESTNVRPTPLDIANADRLDKLVKANAALLARLKKVK